MKGFKEFLGEEDGVAIIEIVLILVRILTPYYGASIKCIT